MRRIEIVHTTKHTPDGEVDLWRPRVKGANEEIVWHAEHYLRKQGALDAVHFFAEMMGVASRYDAEGESFTFTNGLASPIKVRVAWIEG